VRGEKLEEIAGHNAMLRGCAWARATGVTKLEVGTWSPVWECGARHRLR